jgi:hypothetical protein
MEAGKCWKIQKLTHDSSMNPIIITSIVRTRSLKQAKSLPELDFYSLQHIFQSFAKLTCSKWYRAIQTMPENETHSIGYQGKMIAQDGLIGV